MKRKHEDPEDATDVEQFLQMCLRWKSDSPSQEARCRTPIGEALNRQEEFPDMYSKLVAAGHNPIQLYDEGSPFRHKTVFFIRDVRLVLPAIRYARKQHITPIVPPHCGGRLMLGFAAEFPRLFDVNETRVARYAAKYALHPKMSKRYLKSIIRGREGLLHPKFLESVLLVNPYSIETKCKFASHLAIRGVASSQCKRVRKTAALQIYKRYRERYVWLVSSILDSVFPIDVSHCIKAFVGIPSVRAETRIPGYVKKWL